MNLRRAACGAFLAFAMTLPVTAPGGQRSSDRFHQVTKIYVKSVNAENFDASAAARKTLAESGCFQVMDRETDADAVLEITSDRNGSRLRFPFGGRTVSASAALFDRKTGNGLWTGDKSSRWLPSPAFAGRAIARALIGDHGCETEESEWEPFKNLKVSEAAPASDAGKQPSGDTQEKQASNDGQEQAGPAAGTVPSRSPAKAINHGMTMAQVEAVLGPPPTRANLGEKVLYKYKDLTVEFRNGKVTDVR